MRKFVSMTTVGLLLTGLAACGGSTSEKGVLPSPDPDPVPIGDTPLSPNITDGTVIADRADFARIDAFTDTGNLAILPSGRANYSGSAVMGATVVGQPEVDGLWGAINLTTELSGGDRLTGSITRLHTLDGNAPVERLSGSMQIAGTLADFNKDIDADLSGTVTGVFGDGDRSTLTVSGEMIGELQAEQTGTGFLGIPIFDETAAMAGSLDGRMTGDESITFDGNWSVERSGDVFD